MVQSTGNIPKLGEGQLSKSTASQPTGARKFQLASNLGRFAGSLAGVLAALLAGGLTSAAEAPSAGFHSCAIKSPAADLLICDLDGDGLQDLVLRDELKLAIFYQDAPRGFSAEPQVVQQLTNQPCVIWSVQPRHAVGRLMVMTSQGVGELLFKSRGEPLRLRPIIEQPTIIPEVVAATNALQFDLSVGTAENWPLVLVPCGDGLQIWQFHETWRPVQVLGQVLQSRLKPSLTNAGYTVTRTMNLCAGDLNQDGREDLVVRRLENDRTNVFQIFLQQTNGLFTTEPVLTYVERFDPWTWNCWLDLNHDGRVDLIKSTWLNEPSFLPGHSSGKVLVRTFMADAHGRLPSQPTQVFRKNDWTPAVPVADLDGDGLPDLALGYSLLDTHEGLRKEITAKQLDFGYRFYFNRGAGGFPEEADLHRNMIIHMDEMELLLSWGRRQYFERYVKLEGDFNGDGKTDLVVRDHKDAISVYFFESRQAGFSPLPDLHFSCPGRIDEWQAIDLNHDGRSDLIVKFGRENGMRIFLSEP